MLVIGCSGTKGNPVTGDTGTPEYSGIKNPNTFPDRTLWGLYEGYADTSDGSFGLTPLRGADLHVNLVSSLNQTAGIATKVIWGEGNPTMGNYTVRITLHNPYAGNKWFTGFDVRGIFITGAAYPVGSNLWVAGDGEPRLVNPDGWTRWWNPLEFINPGLFGYTNGILGPPNTSGSSAQVNAFKCFADGLNEGEDDILMLNYLALDNPQGRAVFSAASNSRIFRIDFPQGQSKFYYAIDASWAAPTSNPPTVPSSFPPQANSLEPWYIRYDFVDNTLEYDVDTHAKSGQLILYLTICDWQGRFNGAVAPEISTVKLFSTGLFGYNTTTATLTYDDGTQAMYLADLTSISNPKNPGTYWLGVEAVSSNGAYKQSWQDAPNQPLAAYQLIPITVKQHFVAPPPLIKKFGIHAWVLCRSDGSDPAIDDAQIDGDIQWAAEFWGKYGFGFELAAKTYLNSDQYYNLPFDKGTDLYQWQHDSTGLINLYYVHNIIGFSGAYCVFPCKYSDNKAAWSFIVFDSVDCHGWDEILGHELSHDIGMLHDMYLLDSYPDCASLDYSHCGYTPTSIFCKESDAVANNLMYWLRDWPGSPWDYFLSADDKDMSTPEINSQVENAVYFQTHYPNNFKDMQ